MKSIISLILWILGILITGMLLGQLTKANIDSWYVHLPLSSLTPPGAVFGIVWSILYIMLGAVGWAIWRMEQTRGLGLIKSLFIAQLILNFSWTPIFFHFHAIGLALLCSLFILVLAALLTYLVFKQQKSIAYALMPYLFWLMFASYLTLYTWIYS